jgi:hypothetical protein
MEGSGGQRSACTSTAGVYELNVHFLPGSEQHGCVCDVLCDALLPSQSSQRCWESGAVNCGAGSKLAERA